MLTQLSHNQAGRINLRPMDVDNCPTTSLSLRSVHMAEVFLGKVTVHEYICADGPVYDYAYAFTPAVQLRKEDANAGMKLLLVIEGKLALQQGLSEDCVMPEGIGCLFSSSNYTISLPEKCRVRYLLFNIDPLVERLGLKGFEEGRYQVTDDMQVTLNEVLHPPKTLALPENWLSAQMISMLYELRELIELGQKLKTKIYHLDYVLAADSFIQRHLLNDHTAKQISKQVGLNECALKEAFSDYFGVGFAKRRNKLRVEKAKKLLQQTNKQISEIALECGYNNTKSLFNNFSKETTFSPAEWRKIYSI
ncbi:helix-turn-helix domain-containing protein [Flavihumibacter fluvii]|uniref:helix-turn-helix domain-containing protein n=1 Tax=Flavihumibacter fluvii TaxID=2838157 RepID=UPI001BDEE215|nr:AraC family transcriptional regulator [Flavihumibacter fluvii]ULQ52142.1 AraC family transcriptional regulator [Flavihumibacter fluvii]